MRFGSLLLSQPPAPTDSKPPASRAVALRSPSQPLYPAQPFLFLRREPLTYAQHGARARHWERMARGLALSVVGIPLAGIPVAIALWHRSQMEWMARAAPRRG